MTMNNKYGNIIIVLGLAVFLYPEQALSRVERPHRLPKNDPNSAFFIREDMKICEIVDCKGIKTLEEFRNFFH